MSRVLAIFAAAIVALGLIVVGMVLGAHPDRLPDPVARLIGVDESDAVIKEARDDINSTYYRRIPDKDLADASIAGMVRSLDDRFSNYFTPEEYRRFKQVTGGQFSGVGMTVVTDPRGLKVVRTYPGTPARRAGLQPGDTVVAVNGASLKGKSETEATTLIKGPAGTPVTLTWVGDGERTTKRLERTNVNVPVVETRMETCKGVKVGVVSLASFSSGAHAQVYAAVKQQLARGAQAIVLDLRGNGGGLVTEAQLVASGFLRDGPIVTTRGRNVPSRTLNATGQPVAPTQPMVVLVDGNSASASEIVAGALQDRRRATLVGTNTFGKGVFQEVIDLRNGGALDITAGQYFLPSGRNIGGKGVGRGKGLTPQVRTGPDTTPAQARRGLRTAVCTAAAKV